MTLVHLLGFIDPKNDQIATSLKKLMDIDPLRQGYYQSQYVKM